MAAKNQSKNQPVNGTKLLTKCPKNEAQSRAERLKMLQNRGLEGVWADSGCQAPLGGHLEWRQGDFRSQDGFNFAAKMGVTWKQNVIKMDVQFGSTLEAFQNRFYLLCIRVCINNYLL